MLIIGLISLLLAIPLYSVSITTSLFNRIASIILLLSALLSFNALYTNLVASGIGIYSGLFHVTTVSLGMDAFIFVIGALILVPWASQTNKKILKKLGQTSIPSINEYALMILFTTTGASLLVSSSDLVSMYLSIELQSFAVYILASLYKDSESATSAGLKYFLLGALSSAFILLGSAIIYSYTGVTQFESIYALASVSGNDLFTSSIVLGMVMICVGFLFKVAAAPFHNWAPDVYDGVPTIVTIWLSIMPKISIFIFLLEIQAGIQGNLESISLLFLDSTFNVWKNLLLIASLFSLIIGTVVGLAQYRIKRLLAYSTISHVGFLLLALAINTEESIESFLFYIIQYSITNLNTFFVLLAFGYIIHKGNIAMSLRTLRTRRTNFAISNDIQFIDELKGQFRNNPLLGLSLAICLFSMAGIPPLIGFFAKQMVLYSSTHGGYYFLSIIAILVSVISASYYLKIVKVIYFEEDNTEKDNVSTKQSEVSDDSLVLSNAHSFIIATLTMIIVLFVLQPSIILNSTHLLALSLFYY